MEHLGKKIILSVAQLPFDAPAGESGATNVFATLIPLISTGGQILDQNDFPNRGLVFWLVWSNAMRFADPGRLISGRVENAVRPDGKDRYQLAPDSVEIVSPSDLIEILNCEAASVQAIRDLVNIEGVLTLDHPPTPLVLIRWRGHAYGAFKAEAKVNKEGGWSVTLLPQRTEQTVFKFPVETLQNADGFGPDHAYLEARISPVSREPSFNSPICRYEVLMGSGFRRLPGMGFELVRVESDKELLLKYARRFTAKKNLQQLRELLSSVEPDLQTVDTADVEQSAFLATKERIAGLDDELRVVSQALVKSGLLEEHIEGAIRSQAQEYVVQQSAKLSVEIASNVERQRTELERLRRERDSLTDEIEARRRQAQEDLDKDRSDFEQWRIGKEAELSEIERDISSQRASVAAQLENVVKRYETAASEVVENFFSLLPLLGKFNSTAQGVGEHAESTTMAVPQQLRYPDYVVASRGATTPPLNEAEFFLRFEKHTLQSGYSHYRQIDLKAFHLSVKCGDITILGGMSGTGKSSLPVLYAEALAGELGATDRFLQVDVNPSWLNLNDLLGGVNSLERSFEPSASGLYRHILNAQEEDRRHQQESGIYIVSLDEMNLAHVEHYFGGFLQALEKEERLVPVFDPASVSASSQFANHGKLNVPLGVRFIGTVNFDETTRQLSMRLLDRVNLIRLRPHDESVSFGTSSRDAHPSVPGVTVTSRHFREWRRHNPLPTEIADIWDKVRAHMAALGVPVTPRRSKAIEVFISSATDLLSPLQAFDLQVAQRLISQVRGTYRTSIQVGLDDLRKTLLQHPFGFGEAVAAIDDLRRNEEGVLGLAPLA
jgi:hypothetical protein